MASSGARAFTRTAARAASRRARQGTAFMGAGGVRPGVGGWATFQATVIVIWLHPWVKSMSKVPSTSAAFWASTLIRTV